MCRFVSEMSIATDATRRRNPNLDNLEDGEGEGGAPENPVAGGKVALVDDASLAAGVLNK